MGEPEMCERCRAWGCPSAIACGTCYQVQISKLEARVRELEEAIMLHERSTKFMLEFEDGEPSPPDEALWDMID
jgi:hypothetical protein